MDLIKLTELYNKNINHRYLILNNTLKFTTKISKKEKKSAQNFFILKHVIKSFKTSEFFIQKC